MKTLFGRLRWPIRAGIAARASEGPQDIPAGGLAAGKTSPELLYLETKWASLIPFARVADLLHEVLPVGRDQCGDPSVHSNCRRRMEQELGEERQLNLFEDEQRAERTAAARWANHSGHRRRLRAGGAQGRVSSR